MNKFFILLLLTGFSLTLFAQPGKPAIKQTNSTLPHQKPAKRYSSLLWEITGHGLSRPSYLFGTMHVSDKLAFHLGDSFYNALKKVDVVALETNPEHWQDDYSKASFFGKRRNGGFGYNSSGYMPGDRMAITSFAINDYQEAIKAALAVEPSMVNGLLYRTYGTQLDDFEEDTFLDMYIFQAGKKLGKKLAGVENFEESEKIVMEAYRDMLKDKNKKRKSMDYEGMYTNPKKLEDAYRKGDLDVLDSLQTLNTTSEAFEEKFLFKRNEIQAHSIDTILKQNSLFVAVGAAHLPGKRGIIEMLRKMGYTMRPVKMDERNSAQKEAIDKMHFPMKFGNQVSDDGFYQVSIPGKKFYRFTDWNGIDVVQNADMINGAYYMVTRIKTNSLLWGHTANAVHKRIDSFLYENVPGKLLKKTTIVRNGYKGWEILNRTRRGDYQRYNIFVTPFEILFFKISGNGDFINQGTEAQQFFGSIKLKEYLPGEWNKYSPKTGGFSVKLPHQPSIVKDENYGADRLEYAAFDKKGNSYVVMQTNLHGYSYIEEDTFELNLMNDSYGFSSFIDKELSRNFTKQDGYPAMHAKYIHKDGTYSTVKYVIRGPLYYVIAARHKTDDEAVKQFFQSFSIAPFVYPEVKLRKDTAMRYTVQSPIFIDTTKKKKEGDDEMTSIFNMMYEESDENGMSDRYKTAVIGNDTIGEKIYVGYAAPSKYSFEKDSAEFWKRLLDEDEDSTFITKFDKQSVLPNGDKIREVHLTDTGSSRLILNKWIYTKGHFFTLTALTDTLSARSSFLQNFFNTFTPADTLKGESIFEKKTEKFFNDYFSTDSATAKKARKALYEMEFDSLDVPHIKKALARINWNTKNYLQSKKYFIQHLGALKEPTVVPFLKELYFKVKDTAELQQTILNALLEQKNKDAFVAFKDLILQEPPISDGSYDYDDFTPPAPGRRNYRFHIADIDEYENDEDNEYYGNWSSLYDTLSLTKNIFPEMFQLMGVEDYKEDVMELLTKLVDSGYLKANDYETHFSKLYLDAKQLLKKQTASEEKDNIEKLTKKDRNTVSFYGYDYDDEEKELDRGNEEIEQYSILLLPFYDKNAGIPAFFEQLLKSKDRQVVYNAFILLLRNNKPVPDSLFMKYAKADEYRSRLYNDLAKMKELDKFPAAYKTQELIARSLMFGSRSYYNRADTIIYLDKLPVTYKNKKGYVHFFKYKEERDDNYWKLASIGMQPEKTDSVNVKNHAFNEKGERKLDSDKPVKEQLEKMLKELLNSKRWSAADFYNGRGYDIYKTYLPDMVKRRRFRD
jgi:uncharacterized protein YbaP (TraB family)